MRVSSSLCVCPQRECILGISVSPGEPSGLAGHHQHLSGEEKSGVRCSSQSSGYHSDILNVLIFITDVISNILYLYSSNCVNSTFSNTLFYIIHYICVIICLCFHPKQNLWDWALLVWSTVNLKYESSHCHLNYLEKFLKVAWKRFFCIIVFTWTSRSLHNKSVCSVVQKEKCDRFLPSPSYRSINHHWSYLSLWFLPV